MAAPLPIQAAPQIDAATCERMITAATQSCPAATAPASQPVPIGNEHQWDALANSFASLSAAFAWGSIVLAIVAILAGIGWGIYVKLWAEREARREAEECVKKLMEKWQREEAPRLVREHVTYLVDTSLGPISDGEAADEIGEEAG